MTPEDLIIQDLRGENEALRCRVQELSDRLDRYEYGADGKASPLTYIKDRGEGVTGKTKIYIAGKITGDESYRAKFSLYEKALSAKAAVVLNPANMPEGMSRADYMRVCLAMIDIADIAVFLPDWQDSEGAKVERAYCEYIGKDIAEAGIGACGLGDDNNADNR